MEELKRMAGERAERLREADRREAALRADAEKVPYSLGLRY